MTPDKDSEPDGESKHASAQLAPAEKRKECAVAEEHFINIPSLLT